MKIFSPLPLSSSRMLALRLENASVISRLMLISGPRTVEVAYANIDFVIYVLQSDHYTFPVRAAPTFYCLDKSNDDEKILLDDGGGPLRVERDGHAEEIMDKEEKEQRGAKELGRGEHDLREAHHKKNSTRVQSAFS